MNGKLAIAAAGACLGIAPALAYSQGTPAAKISAVDAPAAWKPAEVTITTGDKVTFEATGSQPHFLKFTSDAQPTCEPGVAMSFPDQQHTKWSGDCTFSAPGDYAFICPVHDAPPYSYMRGTVHVDAPTPTPSPTTTGDPTTTPTASATPVASPTPVPTAQAPQTGLSVKLASRQKGARVRGAVSVDKAGSRLAVVLRAKLAGKRPARVGRWAMAAAPPGKRTFVVALGRRARRVLARRGRLTVAVAVTVTPPGGKPMARSRHVRLRR